LHPSLYSSSAGLEASKQTIHTKPIGKPREEGRVEGWMDGHVKEERI
jgi:hypothetical protein